MREEKRWLRHGEMATAIFFLLAAKLLRAQEQWLSKTPHLPTQDDGRQPRKYPRIHPRFYNPFWRNKPRHALSLQTRIVGARKGCFCLFSLYSEGTDEKNR